MKYKFVMATLVLALSLTGCSLFGPTKEQLAKLEEQKRVLFKPMSEAEFKSNMKSHQAIIWHFRCATMYSDYVGYIHPGGSGSSDLDKSVQDVIKAFGNGSYVIYDSKLEKSSNGFTIGAYFARMNEYPELYLINQQIRKDYKQEKIMRPTCLAYYKADDNASKFKEMLAAYDARILKQKKELAKEEYDKNFNQKKEYFENHSDALNRAYNEAQNYTKTLPRKKLSAEKRLEYNVAYLLKGGISLDSAIERVDNAIKQAKEEKEWQQHIQQEKQQAKKKEEQAKKAAEEKAKKDKQE
ncbi:hypothetical protein [Helicobacter cetorum]|uniref:hypothetical protein n=1 Tax=Helicobacter cetorum TaxID=138563 RepID=UPI000CF0E98B|nr:hypothetical protein [Helicobacter cetorum]